MAEIDRLHPEQPVVVDQRGVLRYRANHLVVALMDHGIGTDLNLNALSILFDRRKYRDDWWQLMQLLGWSVDGLVDMVPAKRRG